MVSKRPTRNDVARRAGVAPSTVTLILNKLGSNLGIKPETVKRVEAAALELGYYPNKLVRAMRSGRTGVIGLYLRSDQWGVCMGYWAALRGFLEMAVSKADCQLLVHCAQPDCPTEEAFARQAGGLVDGVVILSSGGDPIAQRLVETSMPAVEIGDSFSILPHLAADGADGIMKAVAHVKERGRKRPALLTFRSPYLLSNVQRRDAFFEATESLYGFRGEWREVPVYSDALTALKSMETMPDAAVCTSDEMAFDLLTACRQEGITTPGSLAVTGFDCLPGLGQAVVLTSVRTPLQEMADLGVRRLLQLINGEEVERSTVLPVSLRIGETT